RRFVLSLVVAAIALRLLVVAGLFVLTDHTHVAFGTFFGDEDYFIKRSLWLRNIALGHSIHPIDLEFAYEPDGRSGFMYVLAFAWAQQAVREDGAAFVAAATIGGLALGFVASRPRVLIACVVSIPILAAVALRIPQVQLRTYAAVQTAGRQHWGAVVVSRGYGYKLLDDRFYSDINSISSLERAETMRFLARAAVSYVALPRPW